MFLSPKFAELLQLSLPSPDFGHCVQVFEGFCTVRVLNEKVLSNFNLT